MSVKNSKAIKETFGGSASEDKSVVRWDFSKIQVVNHSFPGVDSKKSAAFACDNEEKTCVNTSRIPRPPLMPSNSFNATPKNNQSEGKTKKPPSMIPRSRSRKRNENDKVKFDIPPKTESERNEINIANNKKLHGDMAGISRKSGALPPYEMPSKPFPLQKNNSLENLIRVSSLSLKSCQDFVEVTKECDDPYEDAKENISTCHLANKKIPKRDQEHGIPPKPVKKDKDGELEAAAQERTIRHLHDTLKCTFGSLFCKCVNHENGGTERLQSDTTPDEPINNYEPLPDVLSVQGHYEITLKEISNIWRNTVGLIGSIREHAVKFVEGDNKLIDKERLTLEAEMLQLALDFAISYSKLKTDFLLQLVRKRLDVKSLEKTELENFMDSKAFAAFYNNDDLAAIARTVEDLNVSLLAGENQESE